MRNEIGQPKRTSKLHLERAYIRKSNNQRVNIRQFLNEYLTHERTPLKMKNTLQYLQSHCNELIYLKEKEITTVLLPKKLSDLLPLKVTETMQITIFRI